jgi:hypothetical protein
MWPCGSLAAFCPWLAPTNLRETGQRGLPSLPLQGCCFFPIPLSLCPSFAEAVALYFRLSLPLPCTLVGFTANSHLPSSRPGCSLLTTAGRPLRSFRDHPFRLYHHSFYQVLVTRCKISDNNHYTLTNNKRILKFPSKSPRRASDSTEPQGAKFATLGITSRTPKYNPVGQPRYTRSRRKVAKHNVIHLSISFYRSATNDSGAILLELHQSIRLTSCFS